MRNLCFSYHIFETFQIHKIVTFGDSFSSKYSDFKFTLSYSLIYKKILIIVDKADLNACNVNDYISYTKGREITNLIDILKCHHIL